MIAVCSTEAGLDVYKATANRSSSNITAVKMDMSNEADIQSLAEKLAIQHPEGLYALVNNNNNTVVGKDGLMEWMSIDNYKMYVFWSTFCGASLGTGGSHKGGAEIA